VGGKFWPHLFFVQHLFKSTKVTGAGQNTPPPPTKTTFFTLPFFLLPIFEYRHGGPRKNPPFFSVDKFGEKKPPLGGRGEKAARLLPPRWWKNHLRGKGKRRYGGFGTCFSFSSLVCVRGMGNTTFLDLFLFFYCVVFVKGGHATLYFPLTRSLFSFPTRPNLFFGEKHKKNFPFLKLFVKFKEETPNSWIRVVFWCLVWSL